MKYRTYHEFKELRDHYMRTITPDLSKQKSLMDFEDFAKNYNPKPFGEKRTYPQNWPIYYQACRNEKFMVYKLINDAVDDLDIQQYTTNGRPSANTKDILKAICMMAYSGLSTWRIESELKMAKALGFLDNVYKRTALGSYLRKTEITTHLDALYKKLAEPIAHIETQLAVDATGVSVAYGRKRWVEIRTEHRRHRNYKKLHAICGCKTNVVFAASITKGTAHDSPPFEKLITDLKVSGSMKELSADAAYVSRKNAHLISSKGMTPYLFPRSNIKKTLSFGTSEAWGKMIRLWRDHQDVFAMHYHQRSNVECTFSMLKRKFGYYTRAKNDISQTNEILTKVVCLNAAILAEAILEFKLEPQFMEVKGKK